MPQPGGLEKERCSMHKSKEEIKEIAAELLEFLKAKGLPAWQCKEVLLFTKEMLDQIIVK